MSANIRPLAEVERDAILAAVAQVSRTTDAAKLLGIGKTTLYRKLGKYGRVKKVAETKQSYTSRLDC